MIRRRSAWFGWLLVIVLSAALAGAAPAAAYTKNVYNSANNNTQAKNCWCVVASIRTHLKYVAGSTVPTQTDINTTIRPHDKYVWGGSCPGHDPRGWACGLWRYTPGTYSFNDYGYTTQSTADWEMVYGIRASSQPVGALVAAGQHAYDVVGFSTLYDPFADGTRTLNGFYVVDPWYPHSTKTGMGAAFDGTAPNYGLVPNTYITAASWNSTYFTKNVNDGAYWLNKYTVVLRQIDGHGQPSDSPGQTYGDWKFGQLALAAPAAASGGIAEPVTSRSIRTAVESGIATNRLIEDGKVGIDLRGFSVGASVHVTSLAREVASYDLVEIRVRGSTVAIATVDELGGGYSFAALAPVNASVDLFSANGRSGLLHANGLTGSGELVWGWTADALSPFEPFVVGTDSRTGKAAYATVIGRKDSIDLVPGFTHR